MRATKRLKIIKALIGVGLRIPTECYLRRIGL